MTENKNALENESSSKNTSIIAQNAIKESFVLYTAQKEVIDNLSDEDAGKLFKGIFEYVSGSEPNFNDLLKFVFIPIRQQLDRNAQKYAEIKEKRRIAGAKGGKQKLANQANANFANQNQANQAVYVNDNVNVNDNVYLSKDKYKEHNTTSKKESFKKPTLEEIQSYCSERQNNIDAQAFYDYYEANGWKVGKNSMKDFKAAIRNWERNIKNNNQLKENSYECNYKFD